MPEKGADNCCDGDARKSAEEHCRKEVERHGADEGYSCEDKVQALFPVSLEEVDVRRVMWGLMPFVPVSRPDWDRE